MTLSEINREINKCLKCEALDLCVDEIIRSVVNIQNGDSKCLQIKKEFKNIHDPLGAHFKEG